MTPSFWAHWFTSSAPDYVIDFKYSSATDWWQWMADQENAETTPPQLHAPLQSPTLRHAIAICTPSHTIISHKESWEARCSRWYLLRTGHLWHVKATWMSCLMQAPPRSSHDLQGISFLHSIAHFIQSYMQCLFMLFQCFPMLIEPTSFNGQCILLDLIEVRHTFHKFSIHIMSSF